jgi:hypothetical protein
MKAVKPLLLALGILAAFLGVALAMLGAFLGQQ